LLKAEKNGKNNDDWAHDPTDEEPDDAEIEMPVFEPEEPEPLDEETIEKQKLSPSRWTEPIINSDVSKNLNGQLDAENTALKEQIATLKQELATLRHEHLTVQRDAAAKQTELLAQAAHDRKTAETRISALKDDAAAQKHLSSVRIKELEERNDALEQQLVNAQEKYNQQTEELMGIQHALQDLRDTANKKGTQQALELLDAQGQQEKLCKTIHEKDLEIMDAKEKQQELLEKYNAALGRIGEIIGKVMKTRERMRESFAEFDVYIDAEENETDAAVENADNTITAAKEPSAPELLPPVQAPNPKTVEILGKPVGETPTGPEAVIREQVKQPSLWRRIASFF
ncbi:MAG: hypothetical protein J6N99_01265, partial [Schwartzia sp.]|nr:hypothetical protein [Schwartzia sp. (in: firmicutes)]